MVKCKSCNRETSVVSNYCPHCGGKVRLKTRIKKWDPTPRKAAYLARNLASLELETRGITKEKDIEMQMLQMLKDYDGFRHRWCGKRDVRSVEVLGFKHGPDAEIRGMALEVKYAKRSGDLQRAIGQGLLYQTQYPFAVLFIVDGTPGKRIKSSLGTKEATRFVRRLREMGLYLIVK